MRIVPYQLLLLLLIQLIYEIDIQHFEVLIQANWVFRGVCG